MEKLEKLKKSLDNKFIPDNMKDKIRAEIKKLESEIKTDETMTATEVKEEVKEIEEKVEKALEVAEKKEEQAEAKAEEKKEKAPRKAREKKTSTSETKTPKVEPKATAKKKSVFSIAKEIRKDGESWEQAKERASKMMKSDTTETKKKVRTETDKLLAMVRRNKEYKKLAGSSNLPKDAQRRALPRGKRVSQGGWKNQYGESEGGKVYYENRANRVDVGGFKNAYLENGGGVDGIIELKPLELIPLSSQLNRLSGYNWTSGDWESEDGGKPSTMPNSVIVNVHTKQKFRLSPYYIEQKYQLNESKPLYSKQMYRVEKMSENGNVEYKGEWYETREEAEDELRELFGSPFKIYEGVDHYNNKPLYRVEDMSEDGEYVGEWYKTRQEAEDELREMFGNSYDNGGSVDRERFNKFISSQINYIISLKTISQKREPIQNLINNMDDYSGEEIQKRITKDNLKYALQQKTVSKINEVLRISLNALKYVDGGAIIGTPETLLARGLDMDYTTLVGETGAMSSGEMFANGGYADKGVYVETLDEEIDLSEDGRVKAIKTQQGGNKSFGELREMHGASPEALAFDNGGGVFSSNDLWHKPSNSYLTIDNKSGVVKNVKEFNGNRKKEINIDGDVYRKNTTYGTYNSIKDNTVLTKQIVEKNFTFAEGGSLGNHGLKQGDQIIKTMSGGVQKVKTKSGDIVYVNLANGYRGDVPPLPFDGGGRLKSALMRDRKNVNYSQDYEVRYSKDKSHRSGYTKPKMSRTQFEEESFEFFDGGGKLKKGRYSILGEVDGEQPFLYATTDDRSKIKGLVDMAEIDFYELTGKKHNIFVTDEVTDDEVYNYGNGGRTRERKYVNHSQDYEVRYSKDKPHRRGYGYAEGGEISSKQLDLGYQYSFEKDEDNVGSLYKEAGVYSVIGFENGKHFSESFEKFTDAKEFYLDKKGKVKFDNGGVTKNYINRNQLNTITIKKGDQKLTYKVSDVYNGAYKLEDGGNLEKTAFYVSKRNIVKVQLKDGKDVKVANGYWIKKGAKPIHTSKYDDGGEMEYAGGGKIETKIQKKVDEINDLIKKAIDSDGDPLMVVDTNGTWEEPMQYKPIVYKNGRLYIEYFEPYSGKTEKEVVNKSNIDLDGYPTLLNIAKMYRKALKEKGVSYSGGGSTEVGYFKNEIDNDYISEINKYFNKWNSIKTEKDSENFKKIKPPMFGTYKNVTILEQISKFENQDVPFDANQVLRNDFKKEVSKIIDKLSNSKSYSGGGISNKLTLYKSNYLSTANKQVLTSKDGKDIYIYENEILYDSPDGKTKGASHRMSKLELNILPFTKLSNQKIATGGKTNRGGAMVLAKEIRKDGESWQSALKRANEQLKK
jgi:hypothetical protein